MQELQSKPYFYRKNSSRNTLWTFFSGMVGGDEKRFEQSGNDASSHKNRHENVCRAQWTRIFYYCLGAKCRKLTKPEISSTLWFGTERDMYIVFSCYYLVISTFIWQKDQIFWIAYYGI